MNSYLTQRKANSGISLIEALISLTVLSFGLLAIANFQSKLLAGSGYSKTRSEAMALAQQKLDDIRNYTTQEILVAKLKEQVDVDGVLDPSTGEVFPEYAFDDIATTPLVGNVSMTACDFTQATPPFDTSDDAANPITRDGSNAEYTRKWKYCLNSDKLLYAVVEVSWTNLEGVEETVSLETNLSWKNPAASVEVAEIPEEPLVPSATGRAYLGDGVVADGIDLSDANPDVDVNDDGTVTLYKANEDGADVALVDADTREIVLTLEDACKSGVCFGFVKISGKIYFDSSSKLTPSTVYVLASDAAYCARVGSDSPTAVPDADGNGKSDYKYFSYTCYLGGGWYGNIGLLLTEGSSNDRACVGDPNTSLIDGKDNWREMEIAKRRVYRGMLYIREDDGSGTYPLWRTDNSGGTQTIGDLPLDGDGIPIEPLYYSKGIGDSVKLPGTLWTIPDYDGETRIGGHDYVVASMTGNTDCSTPLMRGDSGWLDNDGDGLFDPAESFTDDNLNGVYDEAESYVDANENGVYDVGELFNDANNNLVWDDAEPFTDANGNLTYDYSEAAPVGTIFANTPSDWVCLNREWQDDKNVDLRAYPYLDRFNGDTYYYYTDDAGIPYSLHYTDATMPAGVEFIDGGTTPLDMDETIIYGRPLSCPYNPSRPPLKMHLLSGTVENIAASGNDLQGITLNTSDGADDCYFTDSLGGSVLRDVNGDVINTPSGTTLYYTCQVYDWGDGWNGSVNLQMNDNIEVECTATPGTYNGTLTQSYTGITSSQSASTNFQCDNLDKFTITGQFTAYNNDIRASAGTVVQAVRENADGSSADPVACEVTTLAGDDSVAYFSCEVSEESFDSGWTGMVQTVGLPLGVTCDDPTQASVTIPASATTSTEAFTTFCKGPVTSYTIRGTINSVDDISQPGISMPSISATGGECQIDSVTSSVIDYSCVVPFDYQDATWIGNVTVTEPGDSTLSCSGDMVWTGTITSDATSPAVINCDTGDYAYVIGEYGVVYPSDTAYCLDPDPLMEPKTSCPGSDQLTVIGATMVGVSGSSDGTCTFTTEPSLIDSSYIIHAYSCRTLKKIPRNQTWSGTINFSTNNTEWAEICIPQTSAIGLSGLLPASSTDLAFATIAGPTNYCNLFFP